MADGFVVRFRGVRGSYPTPGPTTLRYGGNTACVEIRVGDRLIILDAGTGLVRLGNDLLAQHARDRRPIVATMFFSHTHHDHTQGFPFFRPAYLGSCTLYVFGPRTFGRDLEDALARAMLPPTFPKSLEELPSFRVISNIEDCEVILISPDSQPQIRNVFRDRPEIEPGTVSVRTLHRTFHPSGGVRVFRVECDGKSVVYASDVEGVIGGDTDLIRFASECDLLIHDAQYTTEEYVQGPMQGWGHSTPEMATLVAHRAKVRQLALFHHDPRHDDDQLDAIQAAARERFPNTLAAYEGLAIEL
ncbi:MAG: MBL fold metallo-hydrolase [Anaerolineae bacterium]|nr:MBL fold metallo-hydrolase [Anaerolineae bacterium]